MATPLALEAEQARLTEIEVEAIEMFINFLRIIGLPKSVGEIYGLLFVAPRPLAMDEIMARLDISLGAASQGLKLLRSFGAVRVVYERGNRRDHYVADLELSRFATVFIEDELQPRIDTALDAIAFTRGRFVVRMGTMGSIALPFEPEVARSIEDCRN